MEFKTSKFLKNVNIVTTFSIIFARLNSVRKRGDHLMKKIKEIAMRVIVFFHFAMIGFTTILLLTGAFRFAIAFIENKTPGFIEWLGFIFVSAITGICGLTWFICDGEDR